MSEKAVKPLGRKAYGHIGLLPGSRVGPGDHHVHEGQARIATERTRDRHDVVIVQEKLDGSCVAVARLLDGSTVALGRAGYPAATSPYEQHHLFAHWAMENDQRFRQVLQPGERLVGEWLAQAHGTRYDLSSRDPFVAFDTMVGEQRLPFAEFMDRIDGRFGTPYPIWAGPLACPIETVLEYLETGGQHGALDPVEGAVWRVERKDKVDFLCKFVVPTKVDGLYLPEVSGLPAVWNWRPDQ